MERLVVQVLTCHFFEYWFTSSVQPPCVCDRLLYNERVVLLLKILQGGGSLTLLPGLLEGSGRAWIGSWHTPLLSLSWEGSREFHYHTAFTQSDCFHVRFSALCNTVMHMNEQRKKRRKWFVLMITVWFSWLPKMKCEKTSRGRWLMKNADTFLVWTRPSLSASVSPSAVSAARPRILWCSHCPGCPSYHSAR